MCLTAHIWSYSTYILLTELISGSVVTLSAFGKSRRGHESQHVFTFLDSLTHLRGAYVCVPSFKNTSCYGPRPFSWKGERGQARS